jgi:APA family basic amino acid/polyamine antiporter
VKRRKGTPDSAPENSGAFLRVLGVGFGIAVTFGNAVGTGILTAPGIVAKQFPSELPFMAVWLAVGMYALVCAPSLAELGAMIPRAGGYYVYAKRAFDGFPAFLVGWTDWLVSCGAIAASCVALGKYAGELLPSLAPGVTITALVMVVALSLGQLPGIRPGSLAQDVMSAMKGVVFLVLLVACFVAPQGVRAVPVQPPPSVPLATALATALLSALFTYDGWDGVIYFGEEVRNPGRDVPRSLFAGVLVITALYTLVNLALIRVLTLPTMAHKDDVIGAGTAAVFGGVGGRITSAAMIVVVAGVANACLLIASRVIVALGTHGALPKAFSRVNARGTPALALGLTALAAVLFILLGKTMQALIEIVGLFILVTDVLTFTAVLVLRRREPLTSRPYRAWGYPATTLLALSISVAIIVTAVWSDPQQALYALLCVAVSYPAYRLYCKVAHRAAISNAGD